MSSIIVVEFKSVCMRHCLWNDRCCLISGACVGQMKASSGRWNPARLCSVLFRVSQVAPGTTLLRDMVLSAHEDLEKVYLLLGRSRLIRALCIGVPQALSTSLSRVSRGSTRELSELAMVLRRVPTTCDKGE